MDSVKNKKILVTGGVGFIGSHLVDKLIQDGNKVAVIDDLSTGRLDNLNTKAKFYKIDIRSQEIFKVFKKIKPQMIFHLAARPIVEDIYQNPLEAMEINIMGTVKILEACRLNGDVKSIVTVSSDKVYGKTKDLPYKEDKTPLLGDHPYEVSKSSADLIARAYFATYALPVAVARFSNTFGPRDIYFNRIIPGIFESIIKNKELLIRSDGKMIREYTKKLNSLLNFFTKEMANTEKNTEGSDRVKSLELSKNLYSVLTSLPDQTTECELVDTNFSLTAIRNKNLKNNEIKFLTTKGKSFIKKFFYEK